ncbi:hypothetical protein NEIG_01257 [Nematocida sp. ERTm5]|nr:hypothetical protein NEIG_01257 [Nematocida sp. ERTm5]
MMEKQEMIIGNDVDESIKLLQPEETIEYELTEVKDASEAHFEQPTEVSISSLANIKYMEEGRFETHYIEEQSIEQTAHEEDECYTIQEEEVEYISENLTNIESQEEAPNAVEDKKEITRQESSVLENLSYGKSAMQITEEYMSTLSLVQQNIIKMEMEISRQTQAAKEQWVPKREVLKEDFVYVPIKGGHWVRSVPKAPEKKEGFFTKLFACLNPFSKNI